MCDVTFLEIKYIQHVLKRYMFSVLAVHWYELPYATALCLSVSV